MSSGNVVDQMVRGLRKKRAEVLSNAKDQVDEIDRALRRLGAAPLENETDETNAGVEASAGSLVSVRPHQFAGLSKSMALQLYMRERGSNGFMPVEDVVKDMLKGGANLGQPGREVRNIKITAKNLPLVYNLSLDGNYISLAETASITPLTRKQKESLKTQRIQRVKKMG